MLHHPGRRVPLPLRLLLILASSLVPLGASALELDGVAVQYEADFLGETGLPTASPENVGFSSSPAGGGQTASVDGAAGRVSVGVPADTVLPVASFERGDLFVLGAGASGATGGVRARIEDLVPSFSGGGLIQVQTFLFSSTAGASGAALVASLDLTPSDMTLQVFEFDNSSGIVAPAATTTVDPTRRAAILSGTAFELELALDGGTGDITAGVRVEGVAGEDAVSRSTSVFTDFGDTTQANVAALVWNDLTGESIAFDVSQIQVRASIQPVDIATVVAHGGERRLGGGGPAVGHRAYFELARSGGFAGGRIASASLVSPNGPVVPMIRVSDGIWRADTGNYADFAEIDTILGFGDWDVDFTLNDGTSNTATFAFDPTLAANPQHATITAPAYLSTGASPTPTVMWTLGCSSSCTGPALHQVVASAWDYSMSPSAQSLLLGGGASSWMPTLPDPSFVEVFVEPFNIVSSTPTATDPPHSDPFTATVLRLNTTGTLFFVPEPTTTAGLVSGGLLVGLLGRRRRREAG